MPFVSLEEQYLKLTPKEIHDKMEEIKKEFGGSESDVPMTHQYWALSNRLTQLHQSPELLPEQEAPKQTLKKTSESSGKEK